MTFFTTPELLEIGDIPMTSLNEKPNRHEALKYYRRVAEHYKLDIQQYERVNRIDGDDDAFQVLTTDRLDCDRTVSGAERSFCRPATTMCRTCLNVPGEELAR